MGCSFEVAILLSLVCCSSVVHIIATSTAVDVALLLHDLGDIRGNVLSFWQHYGLEKTYGGFHGTLDRNGNPVEPNAKGLVQQARHVWAFSTYQVHGYARTNPTDPSTRQQLPSAKVLSQSPYAFMLHNMRDTHDGLWHWNVSIDGQVLQDRKVLYGQWFVLYAFSQYYTAFGDPSAKDLALKTFYTIDSRWHSPDYGGYLESTENGFPAEAVGVGIGLREQSPESGFVRTFNTLLHGIEALTALHRVTSDAVVLRRLLELVDIVCTRMQRTHDLVWEEYVPQANKGVWTPAEHSTINYGHNLEAAWLLLDTLAYLRSINLAADQAQGQGSELNGIDQGSFEAYAAAAVSIGAAAARAGYDAEHGGVFEWGTAEGPVGKSKVWWVQAESMLAFWKLHEATKAVSSPTPADYMGLLVETVKFVSRYLVDRAGGGEEFWKVEADGTWQLSGDLDKDTKGNRWHASYHSSRAPLFLEKWIKEAAAATHETY